MNGVHGVSMNVVELQAFCGRFAGATESDIGAPSNVLVYAVGGKSFAYFKTSEPERWRFSVRVDAERFLELTDVAGVKPARYMGRFHWVTIVSVQDFPGAYLMELTQWSYHKAFGALSKATQRTLVADAAQ
jgi:predicted DNA-binding protein (MmcQ/YjbR family)